jgi:hypothetical protein
MSSKKNKSTTKKAVRAKASCKKLFQVSSKKECLPEVKKYQYGVCNLRAKAVGQKKDRPPRAE